MKILRIVHYSLCYLVLFSISVPALVGQVSVLTQHNDNSRTGQNIQETTLNTANVNVTSFGLLFSRSVDGNIFAQPLYVPGLSIAGGTHNVIYVATTNNSVFAFDADDPNASTALWEVSQDVLGTPVPSQDISDYICPNDPTSPDCVYTDTIPVIGIIATPVIDPVINGVDGTIYVVAKSKDSSGGYHFKLHALSLTTGAEKFSGPKEITYSGLTPLLENNRPGLLLANGMVYMGFGSVGDFATWHGLVMAYDATTLEQVAVYNSTPQRNGVGGAGIWQAGNGLVVDANGDIYAVTSNGNFDVNTGGEDYGSAYLKLSGSTLSVLDYFVPYNQALLNPEQYNVDLGSGGPLLIPNTTLLVGTGKDAVLRVVNTTTGDMGEYNTSNNNNVQNILSATNAPVLSSPVYWDSPTLGPVIYLWGLSDLLKAWAFNGSKFNTTPVSENAKTGAPSDAAALSLSANGSTSGTGILWATLPLSGASNPGPTPGIMYAYDAGNLANELWDSQQNSARDGLGNWAKFNAPTVVNGKVYVATFTPAASPTSGQLMVYGLIALPDFSITTAPPSQSVVPGASASYIVYVNPQAGFNGTTVVTCSGLPSGASCSPASVSVQFGSTGQVSVPLTVTTTTSTAGGSSNFTITGTSGTLVHTTTASLTVTAFALTATALAPPTVTAGSSATSTVTVTSSGGFNSTVNLTCAITPVTAVPPKCSLSSATVSGSGTPMLTVSTVGATASVRPNRAGSIYYAMLLPLSGLTLLGARFRSRSRNPLGWLLFGLMLSSLVWLAACGGGGSSGGGGGGGGGGTTAGSYSVTVTATAGALTQTQNLTLTVQ